MRPHLQNNDINDETISYYQQGHLDHRAQTPPMVMVIRVTPAPACARTRAPGRLLAHARPRPPAPFRPSARVGRITLPDLRY